MPDWLIEEMRGLWRVPTLRCPRLPAGRSTNDLEVLGCVPRVHMATLARTFQFLADYDHRERLGGKSIGNNLDLVNCVRMTKKQAKLFGLLFPRFEAGEIVVQTVGVDAATMLGLRGLPRRYAEQKNALLVRFQQIYETATANATSLLEDFGAALDDAAGLCPEFVIHVAESIERTLRHEKPYNHTREAKDALLDRLEAVVRAAVLTLEAEEAEIARGVTDMATGD